MNKYIEKKLEGTSYVPMNKGIIRCTNKDIDLYIWSDQHFGSNECNYPLATAIINEMINTTKVPIIPKKLPATPFPFSRINSL